MRYRCCAISAQHPTPTSLTKQSIVESTRIVVTVATLVLDQGGVDGAAADVGAFGLDDEDDSQPNVFETTPAVDLKKTKGPKIKKIDCDICGVSSSAPRPRLIVHKQFERLFHVVSLRYERLGRFPNFRNHACPVQDFYGGQVFRRHLQPMLRWSFHWSPCIFQRLALACLRWHINLVCISQVALHSLVARLFYFI